jgi:hypothetical protein
MNCKNCNTEVNQNYCPNCGHPIVLRRIDGHYIFQEVRNVLNFEHGILFTIRELTINPGKNVKEFLTENRNRLVKPVVFLLITSLIYTVLKNLTHFEDGYVNYSGEIESATLTILSWIQGNYGYSNSIMAVFIALWLKLFFRKYDYNIFEIIILLCFVMGIGMLFYSVFGIAESFTQIKLLQFGAIVAFIYTTFALGQFFDKKKLSSYVKALFAYLLGMLSFFVIAILIGKMIDLVSKL